MYYQEIFMLKFMTVKKDFQTWHMIGWQHSQTQSHVRKPVLNNKGIYKETTVIRALGYTV